MSVMLLPALQLSLLEACLAAAVAALVDEDAELLGQWGLLMEWIKK